MGRQPQVADATTSRRPLRFEALEPRLLLSATWYVDDVTDPLEDGTLDHPFDSIQQAINAAADGDAISVASGTYAEQIVLTKGLTVQGAGAASTTIAGTPAAGPLVTISHVGDASDQILIDGFTISPLYASTGIVTAVSILNGSSYITLQDNVIDTTAVPAQGVFMTGSYDTINVFDSTFYFDDGAGPGRAALQIDTPLASNVAANVTVDGNGFIPISGTAHEALRFGTVDGLQVTNNAIASELVLRVGTGGAASWGVLIAGNLFPDNGIDGDAGIGVRVERGGSGKLSYVWITDNDFEGRTCGIQFYSPGSRDPQSLSKYNVDPYTIGIHNNRFSGNDVALEVGKKLGRTLDATYNWWGDPTGPTYSGNKGGLGDPVTGKAYVVPFLTNASATMKPDLVGELTKITLKSTIVPGDKASAYVKVTNAGDADARGTLAVDVYLSADGVLDEGDLLLGTGTTTLKPLRVGKYKTVRVRLTIPYDNAALPDGYQLIAVVDALNNFDESDEANEVASAQLYDLLWEFGKVGTRRGVYMVATDEFGTRLTLAISGNGTGYVTSLPGDPLEIEVLDTDRRSGVGMTASRREVAEVANFTAHDRVYAIYASRVSLAGEMRLYGQEGTASVHLHDTQPGSALLVEGALNYLVIGVSFQGDLVVDNADDLDWAVWSIRIGEDLGSADGPVVYWDIGGGLGYLTVDDTIQHANMAATDDIGTVIADEMFHSALFAGVDDDAKVDANADGVWDLITDDADFRRNAYIDRMWVGSSRSSGDDFVNSNIAAAELGRIYLANVETDNGGDDFGVAALEGQIWDLRIHVDRHWHVWQPAFWWGDSYWWPGLDAQDFTVREL